MWKHLVFLGALVVSASSQARSPCPGLFKYVSQKPGQWEAELTLLTDEELHGVWVRLIFDIPSTQLEVADNFGEIVTTDHTEYLLKNRNYVLRPDEPAKARITAKYDGETAPKLIGFRLNARTVCPRPGGDFHWLETDNGQISNEFFLGDLSNKDFLSSRPLSAAVTGCGTVPLFPEGLASGKKAGEGQWPWQASIYLSKENQNKAICAATLISPKHLITAAHCVTPKNSQAPLHPDNLKIRLGEYSLGSENKGLQEAHAIDIIVHPGYNAFNLDNDLAIIRLDKAVTITDYVRPVCLWKESVDVGSVLRRKGVVVGLGFDNEGRHTDSLTHAKLQVAAPDVCLNGNLQLPSFLSEKTICAQYSKGNGICVGESGSGYSFKSEGPKPVWQLRGLVSVGAALQNKLICDDSTFIVITDLAKHLQWIESNIG